MRPGPALLLLGLGLGLAGQPPPRPSGVPGRPRGLRPCGGLPRRCPPPCPECGDPPHDDDDDDLHHHHHRAANASDGGAPAAPVACQGNTPCRVEVTISRDTPGGPVLQSREAAIDLNATVKFHCWYYQPISQQWQLFSVPSVNDVPDWSQPLYNPYLEEGTTQSTKVHIPGSYLPWGVYVFKLTVEVLTEKDFKMITVTGSDFIYIWLIRRDLKAVLLGDADLTVNFSDEVILNGTMSSDPDSTGPIEGHHFVWYCTTHVGNYAGGQTAVKGKGICHPEQASLKWPWASGAVLTLSPETLKGDAVYYFRMVIQKGDRTAFADKTVHVLRGPRPAAHISCLENCDNILVVSDRFSLFVNCLACWRLDAYKWSILSSSMDEVPFDWTGQTATGRNNAYLSIKTFAFENFPEATFWVSLHLDSWSGATLDLKHSFAIHHGPQLAECKIDPTRGLAMVTKFVVQCSDVKTKHLPLTYKIIVSDLDGVGEITSVRENTLGAILYLGLETITPPSFLPVGMLANNFTIKLYAQVYDSLHTFSQVTLYATVRAPSDKSSPKAVLNQLLNVTRGPTSLLSSLLQKQNWLPAGYLMYTAASVLNNMRREPALKGHKADLQALLINQSFGLPMSTLDEINQVVVVLSKLTQRASEFTRVAQDRALERLGQASQALQEYQRKAGRSHSEQVEILSTGVVASLANILQQMKHLKGAEDPFSILESLSDLILASKLPGDEITVLKTSSFNLYLAKVEKQDVSQAFLNKKHCPHCLHATLNVSRLPGLPPKAPISMMFFEFADDPFPWLGYPGDISTEVAGFRMTGNMENGSVLEITPDVVEVFLLRKNLNSAMFNLTVGPSSEAHESTKTTTGALSFSIDSREEGEVLVHIVTPVTLLFQVLVYAGSQIAPAHLVATFLVPHDTPAVAQQNDLFDPTCAVKEARVICLPSSLLQMLAQHNHSPNYTLSLVLKAPRFVLEPNDKLVRLSIFTARCLDMQGVQGWREGACVIGAKTAWDQVHCVCRSLRRGRRQLGSLYRHLHTYYVTASVFVPPNPVDLRLAVIRNVKQNPVTLLVVLFIMLVYIVLAFWALHRDAMDQFLRDHVIILPDNDPYDNICYLVTVFTGSRCGSGTRADVFVQLKGTESTSDVHCLSHPYFATLYAGSINTFLLTTKRDLGDIRSIRVWHNNEGTAPSWYLSRIKVENMFSRHIWLFMCRVWLSVDTTLDQTFHVMRPDEPLRRPDFFLIDVTRKLGRNHMWFSVFASIVAKPFNRLQRLSCCLAMLLSSLLCNIMFFNLNKQEQTEAPDGWYIRSMMIGIESVLITIPVQVLITFFFTYSQRTPQVSLEVVAPQKQPFLAMREGEHWRDHLDKWHRHETTKTPASPGTPSKSSLDEALPTKPWRGKGEAQDSLDDSNSFEEDERGVLSRKHSLPEDMKFEKKPRIVLPWWCVYIAWFLVFLTSGVSSFFIVFYGLTYGYNKSVEWLFASVCSFCQSVLLVQPVKILLMSGFRTNRLKYSKNLSWSGKYRYTEILLQQVNLSPEEMEQLHQRIVHLRGSRMYQPLTEDEIRIYQRKKRIRRRALLFLSYVLTHFIFLILLLLLILLLHHTDSYYYNQFIRTHFSVGLTGVTKLDDIYRWLRSVLLPLLHNEQKPTFLLDSSSKILGLPLMRQVRAKPNYKRCPPAQILVQDGIPGEIHCHAEYGVDSEDTKSYSIYWKGDGILPTDKNTNGFTYKPPGKKWAYYSYGVFNTYGSGGYVFYFFPEKQKFNSTVRLKELEERNWLDRRTWAVMVDLSTLNTDAGLLCSISVVFEMSQLGVVNSSLSVYSFSLADFNIETSAEIYLYMAILIFFLAYLVDEGYVITQERAAYVRSVYNLLNFALKCIFTVLIALFLWKHFLAVRMIRFYLADPENFIPFHAISEVDHIVRVTLAFLLFLTILKTLRYSRFFYDVRLAQRAVQAALPSLCHMALVVSVYLFVYMAFGYLVFGQHEWNYSNLVHATQTIFSYCVSAFQNTEFSSNRALGVLFLSSFMLVMICILINLFQAVILSAYEEMKQPVYEEPSDEVEAIAYLCGKLRATFSFLISPSRKKGEPDFFDDMLYGQPEKNSRRYLGLKTRNINGKKMVYLVV
ncbi:polycystic kidney disease and receptor for egg jelly-related protein [Perognathus longimembris pacificus]|uniref:polycystic kidney disease and receptor for egg jelly-related protein n=1 Tax=Perognathus longimembris pacificus TaxID=214514 RepID=UPI00201979F3|nr:polycystic kidney disease and receptor for egg jelly-related protein [Perognathus longimembris pacificus]